MGKNPRLKQEKLPAKLKQIRLFLQLSQTQMLAALGFEDVLDYKRISEFEIGTHEPPLRVLLAYARLVKIPVEVVIDDELELPSTLQRRALNKRQRNK